MPAFASLLTIAVSAFGIADAAQDAVHPQIRACAGLKQDGERLVCYDQAVERLLTAPTAAQDASLSTSEAVFGLASARPTVRAAEAREELAQITARVSELSGSGAGLTTIVLDNGQVWRPLSAATLMLEPGDVVTISRGALNSFRLVAPSGRATKVRRVR